MGQGRNKITRLLLIGGCLAALAACAQPQPNFAPLETIKFDPPPAQTPPSAYRIGPGDELEIKFFSAPDLNDRMTVRPDGKISIMFAQDLEAAGLTTDELAADVRAVLAPHVKQLDLVIIVRTFASQKVYVGGEVTKPGPVPLTGDENVLQVLTEAGWVTPLGNSTIVVVRRDAAGAEKIYPINVAQLQSGQDMSQNIQVFAGDMIMVPPSDIAISDRWIDQNIRQLLPFTPSAGVSYNINAKPTQ